jgi:RNA polymerase-binding transcription factor DksA
MPDTDRLSSLRDALEHERDDLRARIGELENDSDGSLTFDENFADSGQVAAEMGENKTIAASLRDQLDEVEAALARFDQGTYGRCEVCGDEIAEARLEAMPAARSCIAHA